MPAVKCGTRNSAMVRPRILSNTKRNMNTLIRPVVLGSFAVLVAGCASVNPTPALRDVQKTVTGRIGVEWKPTELPAELTADGPAQVPLVNNDPPRATLGEIRNLHAGHT